MKEIAFVDAVRMNKYFEQTTLLKVNVGGLLRRANSGKNNYDYNDLLYYLINTIYNSLEEKKAMTNNKLQKHLQLLKQYYEVYNRQHIYIGAEVIDKTKSLERLYINNRLLTGKDGDAETEEQLSSLKTMAETNEQFKNMTEEEAVEEEPVKKAKAEEVEEEKEAEKSIEEYQSLVAKLQDRVSFLETEVKEYQYAISVSSNQNASDEKTINKKNQKIEEYKGQLKIARNDYKKLEKIKSELEKSLGKAEEKASSLNKRIDELALKILDLNNTVERLTSENERLRQDVIDTKVELQKTKEELKTKSEEMSNISLTSSKEEIIDAFILEQLFTRKMTLDNIMNALEDKGFDISKDEVLESLKRINNTVNVKPVIGFTKKYGIVEPPVRTNAKLNYSKQGNTLDIVFLSDYHYDASGHTPYLQDKLDSVYNYCAKNNITNIVTLGDLIDNKNIPAEFNKENFELVKQFIKDFDKILPYDVGVKHFILGGNHDRAFLKYGIDPIEELSFSREDTIPLGYSDAYIYFGGKDVLGLHHEGVPRESSMPDHLASGKETVSYINKAYDNARVNPAERYLDLFGHFHKARVDFVNSYGIVPSINNDRNNDGAWHLKFNLDENGRINYIIINSLTFDRSKELKISNEIVYQKTRKK